MRVAIRSEVVVCAFAASLCVSAMADDAVGVFRVEAPSNGLTAVAMPFEPLSADGVGRFLSGGFAVGEDGRSDRLYQVSSRDGTVAESVWSGGAWLDAESGATSAVRVTAGDTLAFLPGLPEPAALYVFGRVPCSGRLASTLFPGWNLLSYGYPAPPGPFPSLPDGVAGPFGAEGCDAATGAVPWRSVFWVSNSNDAAVGWSRPRPYGPLASGKPRIVGMGVDPVGQSVALDVDTGTRATDLLCLRTDGGYGAEERWTRLCRLPGEGDLMRLNGLLAGDGHRSAFYLAADATRDSDGDGLPDAAERLVYGTSPFLADTDGDGVRDGVEIAWGRDPLVDEGIGGGRFVETFESPGVIPGPLDGQRGWSATHPASATVQTKVAHAGKAALSLSCESDDGEGPLFVEHGVTNADRVVWVDAYQIAQEAGPPAQMVEDIAGGCCFAADGSVLALDGVSWRTNTVRTVRLGEWVRVTLRLDYPNRLWDLYIDGVIVEAGLRMGGSRAFRGLGFVGDGETVLDDVAVSERRPFGLSSDGDELPDEWEMRHFGSLDRDGTGDADGDGLSDLDEFRHRTDPLRKDTDGDGLSDAVEVGFYGTSPTAADPDGDGMDNMDEFRLGTDPLAFEPDVRRRRAGLWAERLPNGDYTGAFEGFVWIPAAGLYLFHPSPASAEVYIDDSNVPDSGIWLSAGWHRLRVVASPGDVVLVSLEWSGPGFARQPVPAESICHIPTDVPPHVELAASHPWYVEGATIRLTATAMDVAGRVVETGIGLEGGEALARSVSAHAYATVVNAATGTYAFIAWAVDDGGNVSATSRLEGLF